MTDERRPDSGIAALRPVFFRGTYDEAFDLLVEARNYVKYAMPMTPAARRGSPADPISLTMETMRLTTRLTQVMAWLMAQRAVLDGEIGEKEFSEEACYRLEGQAVCLKRSIEAMEDLPRGLLDLMERSYRLYSRVQRLDDQVGNPSKRSS